MITLSYDINISFKKRRRIKMDKNEAIKLLLKNAEKNITEITLFACFNKSQYGKIERTKDGFSPSADDGLIKKGDLINEKQEEFINIEEFDNIKEVKQNINEKDNQKILDKKTKENIIKYNKEIRNNEEIEIFDMTKSELVSCFMGLRRLVWRQVSKRHLK